MLYVVNENMELFAWYTGMWMFENSHIGFSYNSLLNEFFTDMQQQRKQKGSSHTYRCGLSYTYCYCILILKYLVHSMYSSCGNRYGFVHFLIFLQVESLRKLRKPFIAACTFCGWYTRCKRYNQSVSEKKQRWELYIVMTVFYLMILWLKFFHEKYPESWIVISFHDIHFLLSFVRS